MEKINEKVKLVIRNNKNNSRFPFYAVSTYLHKSYTNPNHWQYLQHILQYYYPYPNSPNYVQHSTELQSVIKYTIRIVHFFMVRKIILNLIIVAPKAGMRIIPVKSF